MLVLVLAATLAPLTAACTRSSDTKELDAVRTRTSQLEEQVRDLRRQLAGGGGAGTVPPGPSTTSTVPGTASTSPPVPGSSAAPGLPAGFPADFPLPPGRTITNAPPSPDGRVFRLAFTIPGSFDDAVSFYKAELPARGAKLHDNSSSSTNGSRTQVMVFDGFGGSNSVLIVTTAPGEPLEADLRLRTR